MNKENGKLSLFIAILILLLISFLAYEIIYEDIFNIIKDEDIQISNNYNPNIIQNYVIDKPEDSSSTSDGKSNSNELVSTIQPIINNNIGVSSALVSDNYYYRQLDEYGKVIYDGFKNNKENMKTGVYNIDFGKRFNNLLNSEDGEQKLNIAFQSAWNA